MLLLLSCFRFGVRFRVRFVLVYSDGRILGRISARQRTIIVMCWTLFLLQISSLLLLYEWGGGFFRILITAEVAAFTANSGTFLLVLASLPLPQCFSSAFYQTSRSQSCIDALL